VKAAMVGKRLGDVCARGWKCLRPRIKSILDAGVEVMGVVCLCLCGAIVALDCLQHRWEGWVVGVVMLALCVVTVLRNTAQKNLVQVQKQYVGFLQTENRQLREIALSAVALKIAIEHGFKPNLEALNRDLDAVFTIQKVDIHTVPPDPHPDELAPQRRGAVVGDAEAPV